MSKRTNGRYEPDRRTWLKIKCLNREEFVVIGFSDPEGSRHRIGALLLGYYTPEGKLIYAGRVGTGMPVAELERLWQRLQPFVVDKMALAQPPPRGTRFGSPLVLSRVHWVRPEMVVEVSYVEWTPDGLLRHVVYLGERQDKLAIEVRRSQPHVGGQSIAVKAGSRPLKATLAIHPSDFHHYRPFATPNNRSVHQLLRPAAVVAGSVPVCHVPPISCSSCRGTSSGRRSD